MTDEQRRLEELRLWADEQVPTTVPWVRDRVRLLLALVDDLQRVVADLCEESDAAREAMRYRRALEKIAARPQRLSTVMSFAAETLGRQL